MKTSGFERRKLYAAKSALGSASTAALFWRWRCASGETLWRKMAA